MKSIRLKSYAKINLALDVTGLLENGYHELAMIMQQLDLGDDVLVRWYEEKDKGIDIKLKTNKPYLPVDEKNLAYKAALVMAEEYGRELGGTIRIDIGKRIPVAAGLAGGSGNGGAVILALNSLWELERPLSELMEIGKRLGADVPFTMMGMARCCQELPEYIKEDPMAASAALATYDGTRLKPLKPLDSYVILSKPPISVSTKEVYQAIDDVEISERPDIDGIIKGMEDKNNTLIAKKMVNVLEFYSAVKYNCIVDTIHKVNNCNGVLGTRMSGSGPTVFGIMESREMAEAARQTLRKVNRETYLTRTTL